MTLSSPAVEAIRAEVMRHMPMGCAADVRFLSSSDVPIGTVRIDVVLWGQIDEQLNKAPASSDEFARGVASMRNAMMTAKYDALARGELSLETFDVGKVLVDR